jgi:hypothetical protein
MEDRRNTRSKTLRLRNLGAIGLVLASVMVACSGGGQPPSGDQQQASGGPQPSVAGDMPRVGAKAPMFSLPNALGGTISLSAVVGKKQALLYFSMGPG